MHGFPVQIVKTRKKCPTAYPVYTMGFYKEELKTKPIRSLILAVLYICCFIVIFRKTIPSARTAI